MDRASTINGETTTYTFTITLSNIIYTGDYIQIVFPSSISVNSVVNQCKGITNLNSLLTCSLQNNSIFISVALPTGVSQLPATAGDTSTDISFSISDIRNPLSLATSSSIEIYILTSNQNNKVNQKTTGLAVTNTKAATLSTATVNPYDSTLGATTSYLVSFKPSNSIPGNTIVKVTVPSQIGVDTSSTVTCTSILIIESTLTCSYDSSSRTVTISNGFLTKSSYVSSEVQFKISNMINPSTAMTTDSFGIETTTSSGELIDALYSGITYTKACNSPCLTCETDLSTCTSCDTSSNKPYLSDSTCVASCPAGQYNDNFVCYDCTSPCATCTESATKCTSCISNPQLYLYNYGCVSECPSLYEVSSDGVSCEKVGETIIPFIPLGLYILAVVVLTIVKLKKPATLFVPCLIAVTSYFMILLVPIIVALLFRDSHYQSASIILFVFLCMILLNFMWTFTIYRREVRKDVLFVVWKDLFPKTEKFIYLSNYIVSFQCIRLSYCQFAGLSKFDASVKMVEMLYIKLNRASIILILLVLVPIV